MAAAMDPTQKIYDRLPLRSTSGFTKEEILKLVKIIDSYHDFKVAKRVKSGASAEQLQAGIGREVGTSSPASDTEGGHFQTILNNYFNTTFSGRLDAETFFSTNGITKSSPEMSGRDFFERECGSSLHAALGGECIPTKVLCSELLADTFNSAALNSSGAIILERDRSFDDNDANNKIIGTKLLNWFFPEKRGIGGGVGVNFDAQSAVLKDFMRPLINKAPAAKEFYVAQIVTPQNVLDSAGIGYNVLGKEGSFPRLSDNTSRTVPMVPTTSEFSNLFTQDFGKFSIQPGQAFNPDDTTTFNWKFTTNAAPNREFLMDMQGGHRNTGPGVPFLASMIDCILTKTVPAEVTTCLTAKQTENDRMVSPVPILTQLNTAADKKFMLRLLFDIKRLGDHEQANGVYYLNTMGPSRNPYTTIFVTGDTLSALYSRLLGNPTIYIRTEDEKSATSTKSSYIMCYRGVSGVIDPLEKAKMDVNNTLSQLNYYFSKITAFINTSSNSDLAQLIGNLDFYKDATPFVGEDGELSNIMLKAKIYNSLEFFRNIAGKLRPLTTTLGEQKTRLIKSMTTNMPGTNPTLADETLNITINPSLTIAQLNQLNEFLTDSLNTFTPQMNEIISQLQYLDTVKVLPKDGSTSIFSFHKTLFFSENKLESKLDTIKYNKDDITHTVSSICNFARRPVSGKRLTDAKELIVRQCTQFLNTFFITKAFDKATWIRSLEEVMVDSTNETIKPTIMGLFEQIVELATEAVKPEAASMSGAVAAQAAAVMRGDLAATSEISVIRDARKALEEATTATLEKEKAVVAVRNATANDVATVEAAVLEPVAASVAEEAPTMSMLQRDLLQMAINHGAEGFNKVTKKQILIDYILSHPLAAAAAPAAPAAVSAETTAAKQQAVEKTAAVETKVVAAVKKIVPLIKKGAAKKPSSVRRVTAQAFEEQKAAARAVVKTQAERAEIVRASTLQRNMKKVAAEEALVNFNKEPTPLQSQSLLQWMGSFVGLGWLCPVRSGGAQTGGEEDELAIIIRELFENLTDTLIYPIQDSYPNVLIITPSNYVNELQTFPHPLPTSFQVETSYKPMRTGLSLQERSMITGKTKGFSKQQIAIGGTKKQKKQKDRQTRKVGGAYIQMKISRNNKYDISEYDTSDQVKRATEFFELLKEYKNTLLDEKRPETITPEKRNKLREKWYEFTSMVDAEGTPDLALVKAGEFSYDIRMLKTYVDFSSDIIANVNKALPLGDTKRSITVEGVALFLDPLETKRIGENNILTYKQVKDKNEKELMKLNELNNKEYNKNKLLCEYNIAMMELHIEETKVLIQLVGQQFEEPVNYLPAPEYYLEEEPATAATPKVTKAQVDAYLSLEAVRGGKRKTYKLRKSTNNKSRRM